MLTINKLLRTDHSNDNAFVISLTGNDRSLTIPILHHNGLSRGLGEKGFFEKLYSIPQQVLFRLDDEDQKIVFDNFYRAVYRLSKGEVSVDAIMKIMQINISSLIKNTSLLKVIERSVSSENILYPVAERVRDGESLTHHFDHRDFELLTQLSVLMKLLVPAFEMIAQHSSLTESMNSEKLWQKFCDMMIPVFHSTRFFGLYVSLLNFTGILVNKQEAYHEKKLISSQTSLSTVFRYHELNRGYGSYDFSYEIFCNTIKRLVMFNPLMEKNISESEESVHVPNIVVYIDDSIRRYTHTRLDKMINRFFDQC